MKSMYDIIIRPIITEQSMEHTDLKKYVFEVPWQTPQSNGVCCGPGRKLKDNGSRFAETIH